MNPASIDPAENKRRMLAGELYYAFAPDLIAERTRCTQALERYNDARQVTRRRRVELWRDLIQDLRPMPPTLADAQADEDQFNETDPWTEAPIRADFGYNIRIAPGSFLNAHAVFLDTVPVTIGARTLIGSSCSFFSGGHPTDPAVRHGFQGPEFGKPISIGEDCWLGGNVTVLPGVTIGRGTTVGAGSVVSRDLPEFVVAVGVPARVVKSLENTLDGKGSKGRIPDDQ